MRRSYRQLLYLPFTKWKYDMTFYLCHPNLWEDGTGRTGSLKGECPTLEMLLLEAEAWVDLGDSCWLSLRFLSYFLISYYFNIFLFQKGYFHILKIMCSNKFKYVYLDNWPYRLHKTDKIQIERAEIWMSLFFLVPQRVLYPFQSIHLSIELVL